MSIWTLRCIGGPYDGDTIDVNDRVLMGDVPIDIVGRDEVVPRRAKKIGEYHVRSIEGEYVLSWVENP